MNTEYQRSTRSHFHALDWTELFYPKARDQRWMKQVLSFISILYWHERIDLIVNWANQKKNEIPSSESHNSSVEINAFLRSIPCWMMRPFHSYIYKRFKFRTIYCHRLCNTMKIYLLSDFLNTQNTIVVVKIWKLQDGKFQRPNIVRFSVFHLW